MKTEYPLEGGVTRFTVPWPYLSKSHVVTLVDDTPVAVRWVSDNEIEVTDGSGGPALGNKLTILRVTPDLEDFAEIKDAANLTAEQLNRVRRQLLYLLQERSGGIAGYIGAAVEAAGPGLVAVQDNLDRIDAILAALTGDLQTLETLQADITFAKNEALSLRKDLTAEIAVTDEDLQALRDRMIATEAVATETGARVTTETQSRVEADNAMSQRIDTVEAAFVTADAALQASITAEQTARADADEAMATTIEQMGAGFTAEDAAIRADIDSANLTRANADNALAASIESVRVSLESADATLDAKVNTETIARVNADSALSTQITTLDARLTTEKTNLQANIDAVQAAVTSGDSALATQMTSLTASVNEQSGADLAMDPWFVVVPTTPSFTRSATSSVCTVIDATDPKVPAGSPSRKVGHCVSTASSGPMFRVKGADMTTNQGLLFQVQPGDELNFSLWVAPVVGVTPPAIGMRVLTRAEQNGTETANDIDVAQAAHLTGWTLMRGTYKVPSGVYWMRLFIRPAGGGEFLFALPSITKGQPSTGQLAFQSHLVWDFTGTVKGWSSGGATLATTGDSLIWTPTASNPSMTHTLMTTLRYTGRDAPIVRARVRRLSGSAAWEGLLCYGTPDHGAGSPYYKAVAEPANPNEWNVLEWDMAALTSGGTDYLDSTIISLRMDLVSAVGDSWEIDWITVGDYRATPGGADVKAINAAITTVSQARADGDAALAQQITSLESTVNTKDAEVRALINDEASARASSDSANASSIQTLQAVVGATAPWVPHLTFDFAGSEQGWLDGWGTFTPGPSSLSFTTTSTNPYILRYLTGNERFVGANHTKVRIRFRRLSTSGTSKWEGHLYYFTAGHVASGSYRKSMPAPSDLSAWNTLEFDMANLTYGGTDWIDNEITAIRIDLGDGPGDVWEIDWVSIGEAVVVPGSLDTEVLKANYAAVQVKADTNASKISGVEANYTVKVQARSDGRQAVAGIGLAATTSGSVAQSEIILMADRLLLTPPGDANGTPNPIMVAGVVNGVNTTVFPEARMGDKTLGARVLVDGAIETRHMKIKGGVGASVWFDPNIADPSAWELSRWGVLPVATTVTDGAGGNVTWRSPTGLTASIRGARRVPVIAGRRYRISCLARRSADSPGKLYLRLDVGTGETGGLSYVQPGSAFITSYSGNVDNVAVTTTWARYSWEFVLDTSYKFMSPILILNYNNVAGWMEAQDIRIEEMIDSSLIVQGGIAADRIDTRDLTIKDSAGNVIFGAGQNLNINRLSAAVDFVPQLAWDFSDSREGWINGGANATASSGVLSLVSIGTDPVIYSPTLALDGSRYTKIRVKVRRTAGTGWDGTVYYSTTAHAISGSYRKVVSDSTVLNKWTILEWDMEDLSMGGLDWVQSTITQIRLDLGAASGDAFDIDWIAVGRIGPMKIDSSNVSTFIANGVLGTAQIGQLTAANLTVQAISDTVNGGAASGGRVAITSNRVEVYDTTNALRVRMGYLL